MRLPFGGLIYFMYLCIMGRPKLTRCCIYQIRNTINEKLYIGYTSNSITRRSKHFSELKHNTHHNKRLQHSYNKYGKNAFIFEIIEDCDTDSLSKREHYWVTILRVHNPEYGYNIDEVDRDSPYNKGRKAGWHHTEETKEKIRERSSKLDNMSRMKELQRMGSEASRGLSRTIEQCINIKKGKPGPYKIIQVFDLKGTLLFECDLVQEASMKTNIKQSNLRNNLCGLSNRAGSFIFKWKEVYHR